MRIGFSVAVVLACAAGAANAQLYRWTDEKGRVHITDTPPPPSAKSVQKTKPGAVSAVESQQPFELTQAIKDFPVTLYTSPSCKEGCAAARAALNRRSVPFKEVQVSDEPTKEALKRASGGNDVPTLVVGRSVHRGFEQGAYDALLDSARYPKAGLLPPRAQARPVDPAPEAAPPPGPYAPKPPRTNAK